MSRRSFLEQDTRQRATETIRKIEAETAAEVVVAVRKAASRYWHGSLVFGGVCAAVVLLVMLFSPTVYHWLLIAVDTLLTFAVAMGVAHAVPGLKRALTPRAIREGALDACAHRVFDDLGIAGTKDATGLLILVALLERKVVVRPDSGVPVEMMSERYLEALERMQEGVSRFDEDTFLDGMLALAEPLAQVLPRQPDDENELSDEIA
jgi:putative membrane protein